MYGLLKYHFSEFRVHFFVALTAGRRGADRAFPTGAGTKIRYPTRFSRLFFSASEPSFAFGPASDHRPRGTWGAPHTTEEQRQPSLSLLHNCCLSCNLGVAPSSITLTRLAASNSVACLCKSTRGTPACSPSHNTTTPACAPSHNTQAPTRAADRSTIWSLSSLFQD